jgi:hypothetical protein
MDASKKVIACLQIKGESVTASPNVGIPLPAELRIKVYRYLIPQNSDESIHKFRLISRQFKNELDHELKLELCQYRDAILSKQQLFELDGPEPETYIEARRWRLRQSQPIHEPVSQPTEEWVFPPEQTSSFRREALSTAFDLHREVIHLGKTTPFYVKSLTVSFLKDQGRADYGNYIPLEHPVSDAYGLASTVCSLYECQLEGRVYSVILHRGSIDQLRLLRRKVRKRT